MGYVESDSGECHHPIPFIFGLNTRIGKFKSGDIIKMGYGGTYYQYKPKNAFCKLDQIILRCDVLEENNISCLVPLDIIAKHVSISFDAIHWSSPLVFNNYLTDNKRENARCIVPIVLCLFLSLLIFIEIFQHFGFCRFCLKKQKLYH